MTEIKIPFIRAEVKEISHPNQPDNVKGLELNVSPIVFGKFFEQVPPNSFLNKMELAFF